MYCIRRLEGSRISSSRYTVCKTVQTDDPLPLYIGTINQSYILYFDPLFEQNILVFRVARLVQIKMSTGIPFIPNAK